MRQLLLQRRRYPSPWLARNWTCVNGVWSPDPELGGELTPIFVNHSNPVLSYETFITSSGGNVIDSAINSAQYGMAYTTNFVPSVGNWYRLSFNLTLISGSLPDILVATDINGNSPFDLAYLFTVSGSNVFTWRSSGPTYIFIENRNISGNFSTGAISLKPIVTSNLFAVRNFGRQVAFCANATIPVNYQAGVLQRATLDAEGNIVHGIVINHDRSNLHMVKIIDYVYQAESINAAAAYADGRRFKPVWVDSNTLQAWYGPPGSETQVGGNIDVSGVPPGTYAGFGPCTGSAVQMSGESWN